MGAAMERQRQHRHIVDGLRLDQRTRRAEGDAVKIRLQLLVQLDQRLFDVVPHLEANNRHARTIATGRIDILDAGNLPQQLFHRPRDTVLELLHRGPRHRHEHIDHRDLDLGLFFPRQQHRCRDPKQHRCQDDQRRQARTHEGRG
jgi:hypothetical protein